MTIPSPGEVVLRTATPEDAAVVGRVTVAAYEPLGWRPGDPYHERLRDARERVAGGGVLVAEVEGEVLGAVTVTAPPSPMFEHDARHGDGGFRMLAVAPTARGRGLGRALTLAALDRLVADGRRRALITTMEMMTTARALYAELGFVRRRDLDVRYPRGRGLAMALDLVADAAAHFAPPGPVPDVLPWYEDVQRTPDTSCA